MSTPLYPTHLLPTCVPSVESILEYPLRLSVIHMRDIPCDLDGPVIKWALDTLVWSSGIPDDSAEYIQWSHDRPIWFVPNAFWDCPMTRISLGSHNGLTARLFWEVTIGFPMPLYNRLPHQWQALHKLRNLVRYATMVAIMYPKYNPKDYLHLPTDPDGKPLWKRPMSWLTFADRYYQGVLMRKRVPKTFRKYYGTEQA